MKVVRYVDRPDLRARRHAELARATFPPYMHESEVGNRHWGRLYSDFPDFQVALLDGDELLAEAHALPLPWDGSVNDLPSGWEEGFVRGMTSVEPPTALMALAISVAPARQGQRLSSRMIESSKENARAAGLRSVIAPVDRRSRSATRSSRSSATRKGVAPTDRNSIPGSGSTSMSAARSSGQLPGR